MAADGARMPRDGFLAFRRLGALAVAPDGRRVALQVTVPDRERNAYRSEIWLYDRASGTARAFTAGPADSAPAWSPDGRHLAFLAARGEEREPQVYLMPADGGEARPLSKGLRGASGLAWSPRGDAVAVIAWKDEPEPETADLWQAMEAEGALPTEGERTQDVFLSARIKYRYDGVGYANDRRRHICLVPVADIPGEGRWLTAGSFDVGLFAWHPGGERITFVRGQANDRGDEVWMVDLCEVDVAGGEPRWFARPGGRVAGCAWSPAGDRLAVVADDFSHGPATDTGLWLYGREGGAPRRLLAHLDRPVGPGLFGDTTPLPTSADLVWSADGGHLYVQVLDRGSVVPYRVTPGPDGEEALRLVPDTWVGNCAALSLGGDRLWCLMADGAQPAELWELPAQGGEPLRATDFNTSRAQAHGLRPPLTLRYPSPDGRFEIEAFVSLPPDFTPGRRHPLLLMVHGGPHGSFGHDFDHEVHHHAASGRIVLRVNPRGSSGYGQAFTAACVDDWGGGDYQDIMAGVDELIARGWVDPSRMAVTGISYGGFMTSWIITHTDRFACAVPEMLVADLISMWGTSDIGWFLMEEEILGSPMRGWEKLWAHSPLASVGRCRTPALIIEGEADYRCPIGQGEELYTGLRRQGVEAVLVRLQGASHVAAFLAPPRQRLARKALVDRWLERHGVAEAEASPVSPAPDDGRRS